MFDRIWVNEGDGVMRLGLAFLALVLGIGAMFKPESAHAWGEFGHLTVCDFAYRKFTPTTRERLKELFNAPSGITVATEGDTRRYTSFNVGCLEEDERPRKHPADHFINVDRALPAITSELCPLSETSGQPLKCILSGIRRDLAILKDTNRSRQERVIALMAIGHWVGDIHQPLHVSYKDDVGGNSIGVSFQGKCGIGATGNPYRPGSLHAVWDNCLLENGIFQRVRERADYKPNWSRRTITYRAVDTLVANTTVAEQRDFVGTEPWQWAAESYVLARQPSAQYCVVGAGGCQYTATMVTLPQGGQEKGVRVDAAYLAAHKDIAGERVKRAGIRLAHLVNLSLDPVYGAP